MAHKQSSLAYIAPLDGIRAIAILGVLVFHISPRTLKGGFIGVDVFFVLSGFLIASILLRDLRAGRFSFREFYLRRIQRLLPNIIATVFGVLLLWTFFSLPSTARPTGIHGLWTLFNLSNIYVWRNLGGYWGNAAEWAPLTHTWSLGVEEQFYLLFPASLVLLVRFQRHYIRIWLGVAALVSFGLYLFATQVRPVAAFYLLPTRVWELLLGAFLAAYRTPVHHEEDQPKNPLGETSRRIIGWLGLALIVTGFFFIGEGERFAGWMSAIPTVGAVLLIVSVADGGTRLSQLLSSRLMVRIGKLSYSLYLWHWPLITLGKIQADLYGFPRIAGAGAGGAAAILLAWAAYFTVEQPLRRRGLGRPRRLVAIAFAFCLVALYAGYVGSRPLGADPDHQFDPVTFSGKLFNAGPAENGNPNDAVRYYDVHFPPVPSQPNDIWRTGGIVHLYDGTPKVVVLGSSHALMYARVIDDICRELNLPVAFIAVDATSPFFQTAPNSSLPSPSEAHDYDETRRKWLREWHPEAVFLIDRWIGETGTAEGFDSRLRSFFTEASPMAGRLFFVTQAPVLPIGQNVNLREFVTWRTRTWKKVPRFMPENKEPFRQQIVAIAEKAAADFPTLRVLRADLPFYHQDGSVRYFEDRKFFYADDDHLSDAGTDQVRSLFHDAIVEAHQASQLPAK